MTTPKPTPTSIESLREHLQSLAPTNRSYFRKAMADLYAALTELDTLRAENAALEAKLEGALNAATYWKGHYAESESRATELAAMERLESERLHWIAKFTEELDALRAENAALKARLGEAVEVFETILNFSDLEMQDGDAARNLAAQALKKFK